jgi:WD40 repeat protein
MRPHRLAGVLTSEGLLLLAAAAVVWLSLDPIRCRHSESARGLVIGEHTGPVVAIAYVPAASNIVSLDSTGEVLLWDLATRRVQASMGSLAASASSMAMAPDGGALATGGRDGAVRIWKTATGEHQTIFASSLGPIRALAFSRDGHTIAVAEGETVILLDSYAPGAVHAARS